MNKCEAIKKEPLTRQDLDELFLYHCCPNICPHALEDIPDHVVKKCIAKSIYRSRVIFENWDRRFTMKMISEKIQVSMRTMENYFPTKQKAI